MNDYQANMLQKLVGLVKDVLHCHLLGLITLNPQQSVNEYAYFIDDFYFVGRTNILTAEDGYRFGLNSIYYCISRLGHHKHLLQITAISQTI